MASLTDVVVSRRKSIATLEAEVAQWKSQIQSMPIGDGRKALEGIVKVKEQRLLKLRAELVALLSLEPASDSRQLSIPDAPQIRKK